MDELSVGKFRAGDVRRIVKRHCPDHPAAQSATACGSFLAQQLMPPLEKRNVRIARLKPRTYERTRCRETALSTAGDALEPASGIPHRGSPPERDRLAFRLQLPRDRFIDAVDRAARATTTSASPERRARPTRYGL